VAFGYQVITMKQEYTGITGYKTTEEVKSMALFQKGPLAMYGVLCVRYQLDDTAIEGSRSPPFNELKDVLAAVPENGLPVIHYCTRVRDGLGDQVERLFTQSGIYDEGVARAVQLNIDWPHVSDLEQIKERFPEMAIVGQMPDLSKYRTDELFSMAQARKGLIDYALVDVSRGAGAEFGSNGMAAMQIYRDAMPDARIGIAGGLGKDNVANQIARVKEVFDEPFFIDAEGKLFDRYSLDLDECLAYWFAASR